MKKFFTLYLSLIFCLALGFCVNNFTSNVYARDTIVTDITSNITLNGTQVIKSEDDYYHANFNYENANHRYATYTIETELTVSPTPWDDLTSTEKDLIIADMVWKVNDTTIVFTDNSYYDFDFNIVYYDTSIYFTPKKPGLYLIECFVDNSQTLVPLYADYATPTELTLKTDDNINQTYEEFTSIWLYTSLNLWNYTDDNIVDNYTYSWYINNTDNANKLPTSESDLWVTKDMIRIEEITFIVILDQIPSLTASITINITTNNSLNVSIEASGNLQQVKGEHNEAITFTAIVPTSDYEIVWYLQSASSNVYKKQSTIAKSYTFNPLVYSAGTYRVFAKVTADNLEATSNILTIELNKKTLPNNQKLTISSDDYSETKTGVQGFELSVNSEEYYDDNRIVWVIGGAPYAVGSKINFEPELANEYYIEVRLLDDNGNIIKAGSPLASITIEAKSNSVNNLWLYGGIAFICLVIICTLSIIISNKKREKIW